MNIRKRLIAVGGGMLLGVAGVAHADTTASSADMAAELAQLRARVAEMESRQNANWLNERRTEEVKSLVREVLADADTRASLLQSGVNAGHDGQRFFLASDDGTFLMNIGGQIQTRYVLNHQHGPVFDQNAAGFELRRAKIQVDGHVGSPRFTYALRAATHSGALTDIEVATIGYEVWDGFTVRAGRDKAPFLREELVASSHQLAVERSLVNELFTTGYTEGIYVDTLVGDNIRLAGSINNGGNAAGTNFVNDGTDLALTGRVDVRVLGGWEQWNDFTSWQGSEDSLFVGAAVHWEVEETGNPLPNDRDLGWTIDASYKTSGLGLYAAVMGAHQLKNDLGGPDLDLYGVVLQGSYLVTDRIEPFLRYEFIRVDGAVDEKINIGTIGANYYINGHAAKLTVDLVWAFDEIPAPAAMGIAPGTAAGGTGLRFDAPGEDDQVALRAQFQLLF